MLLSNIILPKSNEPGLPTHDCSRCGVKRPANDGVHLGSRFVCGVCWRRQAVTKKSATRKKK